MNRSRLNQNRNHIISRVTVNVLPNNQLKDEFDKKGTYSDRINWKINAVVAFITLCLFGLNLYTLKEVRKANYIAQRGLDSSIASGKAANIRADSLLKAQIDVLNESKNQFKAANDCIVVIKGFRDIIFERDKPFEYSVTFASDQKQSVKLDSVNFSFILQDSTKEKDWLKNPDKFLKDNEHKGMSEKESYYFNEIGITLGIPHSKTLISNSLYDKILKRKAWVYIFRNVTYKNLALKETKIYKFIYRIGYKDNILKGDEFYALYDNNDEE